MIEGVLDYWFGEVGPDQWWERSEARDRQIRERFLEIWETERSQLPERFLDSPTGALAAVILFDQFARNMHRGHADAFSTDSLALAVARGAIANGFDARLSDDERAMLYMPFMHSEHLDDQERSVALFTALGQDEPLKYAKLHKAVIERFGRFPARNPPLGRKDRPGETEARAETSDW